MVIVAASKLREELPLPTTLCLAFGQRTSEIAPKNLTKRGVFEHNKEFRMLLAPQVL